MRARTADEYLAFISQHFELSKVTLDRSVLDDYFPSVVPDANFSLREFCQKDLLFAFIGSDMAEQIGIAIHIDRPQELGADPDC